MQKLTDLFKRSKRSPVDVVGIDIATSGTKVARLKKSGDSVSLVAAELLAATPQAPADEQSSGRVVPLSLSKEVTAPYASFAVTGENSIVKLLNFPGHFDAAMETQIGDHLGLGEGTNYRIGYKLVLQSHGRSESRVLGVALPETDAATLPALLPTGRPAPISIEIAGLAAMTAFLHGPGKQHAEEAVGVIEFGTRISFMAIFNKSVLCLVRKFDLGTEELLERIQSSLGVDMSTAQGILVDGAFDISQPVTDVMQPFMKQVAVSRDFVERRDSCRVSNIYVSGGLAQSRDCLGEIRSATGLEPDKWSPFDGLNIENPALSEQFKGQEFRLSAAIGAALGTFEEA